MEPKAIGWSRTWWNVWDEGRRRSFLFELFSFAADRRNRRFEFRSSDPCWQNRLWPSSLSDVNGSSRPVSILFTSLSRSHPIFDRLPMVIERCRANPSDQSVRSNTFPRSKEMDDFSARVTDQINRIFHYFSPHTWFNWLIGFVVEVPLGFNPLLHKRTWKRGIESPATEVFYMREKYGYYASNDVDDSSSKTQSSLF